MRESIDIDLDHEEERLEAAELREAIELSDKPVKSFDAYEAAQEDC